MNKIDICGCLDGLEDVVGPEGAVTHLRELFGTGTKLKGELRPILFGAPKQLLIPKCFVC